MRQSIDRLRLLLADSSSRLTRTRVPAPGIHPVPRTRPDVALPAHRRPLPAQHTLAASAHPHHDRPEERLAPRHRPCAARAPTVRIQSPAAIGASSATRMNGQPARPPRRRDHHQGDGRSRCTPGSSPAPNGKPPGRSSRHSLPTTVPTSRLRPGASAPSSPNALTGLAP
jgi:hypothetical protein